MVRIEAETKIFLLMLLNLIFVSMFWIGFHSIDLCRNEKLLAVEYNLPITETLVSGSIVGLDECYNLGLIFLAISLVGLVISFYFTGYCMRCKK